MRWPLTTLLGVTDVLLSSLEATSSSLLKYLFLIVDVLPLMTSMSAMSSRYENVWTVLEFVIGFVFTSLTIVTINRKRKTFMISFHHSNITITCFKSYILLVIFLLRNVNFENIEQGLLKKLLSHSTMTWVWTGTVCYSPRLNEFW